MDEMETPRTKSENNASPPPPNADSDPEKGGEQQSAEEAKASGTAEEQNAGSSSPGARTAANPALSQSLMVSDDVSLTFPQRVSVAHVAQRFSRGNSRDRNPKGNAPSWCRAAFRSVIPKALHRCDRLSVSTCRRGSLEISCTLSVIQSAGLTNGA